MKRIAIIAFATLAAVGGANAADIYNQGGSTKDAPGDSSAPAIWSGIAITGMIGYANRDIDGGRTINGEAGFYRTDKNGPDRKTTCTSQNHAGAANYQDRCGTDFNVDDTDEPARYELPLLLTDFAKDGDFSSDGIQGGVELGFRRQMGGWVPEVAIGLNIDGNSKTSQSYDTVHALTLDPAGAFGGPYPIDPADAALLGRGSLSIEKEGDVYAVARLGHVFGDDQRVLVGVGAGVVAGRFNIKGAHAFDGDTAGTFSTQYDETETAIGYALEAYARYKMARNVDFGLLGQWKDFGNVSASGNASKDFPGTRTAGNPIGLYGRVSDKADFNASEFVVKGTLTYTID